MGGTSWQASTHVHQGAARGSIRVQQGACVIANVASLVVQLDVGDEALEARGGRRRRGEPVARLLLHLPHAVAHALVVRAALVVPG
eukprot:scaffold102986_cov48-Phaeocystis_antarctica.AAC.1